MLGNWSGSATPDHGTLRFTFVFAVSPDGSVISDVTLYLPRDWSCAGESYGTDGGGFDLTFAGREGETAYVSNGSFPDLGGEIGTLNWSGSPADMDLPGQFSLDGTSASGTWRLSSSGSDTGCSGHWAAHPGS
jgi:hypothetical protein